MLYRVAHAVNASYAVTIAGLYIAAFVVAFSLLFIFPQVTLLLLFLGLASLGLTITLGWAIDAATRRVAKRAIDAGRCPRCGRASVSGVEASEPWTCSHCHSQFHRGGVEVDERERAHWVEDGK
jgi:ribosomal protein L37AE/L43A